MAQLEEQLNQILGNPQAMEQIMALAQTLTDKQEEPQAEAGGDAQASHPEGDALTAPSPLSALGDVDPRLLRLGMGLLSEYSAQDDKKTALLAALKPFLKPERQEKMDQAVRIARLTRVIRTALKLLGQQGEEEEHV